MRRAYAFLMIALTFISFLYLTSAESDDPVPDPATWMPDANLRAAVREILDLSDDEVLTKDDMQYLIVLDAPSRNIGSLRGIQYATNLEKIKAWDNNITFLPPLGHMQALVTVRLSNNPFDSSTYNNFILGFICQAPNIKRLAIRNTGITDCSPLLNLSKLYWLRIRGNSLTNAHLLSEIRTLTNVDIDIPEPTDTTPPTVNLVLNSIYTPNPDGNTFYVKVQCSEPVRGFENDDIVITSDVAVTCIQTLLGVKRQTFQLAYRVNTSDLPCRVSLQMPADHVTDDSDNPNTTSNTLTVSLSSSD